MTFGLVLDPPESNTALVASAIVGYHSQLDLNSGPIRVDQAGIDWGDAAITAFMAEQGRIGAAPVDYVIPNRTIVIPLAVFTDELGGITYDQAKRMLTAKIGRIQMEGGVLKRTTDTGAYSPIYADIVDAALNFPDIWGETAEFETNVRLTLTALPDFYGQEIALDLINSSSFGDFAGVLQQNGTQAFIAGDFPARTRIVLTNGASSADQRAIFGGFRSRYTPPQDAGSSAYRGAASLILDSSDLYTGTVLTTLVSTSLTGATGGTAGRQNNLQQGAWVPVVDMAVAAPPSLFWRNLTHIGTYRVLARVYTTNGDVPGGSDPPPFLRLAWSTSPAVYRTINPTVQLPGSKAFYIMDLGQVILPQMPDSAGNISDWQASIQAYVTGSSVKDMYVDRVYFVPLDESAWFPTAPPVLTTGVRPLVAADDFNTLSTGGVGGRTAPLGGSWSSSGGTGDLVSQSQPFGFCLLRTNTGDGAGNPTGGRFAILSYSATNIEVSTDFFGPNSTSCFFNMGIVGRYNAGVGNCILFLSNSNGNCALHLYVSYGGGASVVNLASVPILNYANTWMTLNLRVFFNGQAIGMLLPQGGQTPIVVLQGYHQELANPSGSLATGNVGINDHAPTAGGVGRFYDNFFVRSAGNDTVLASGAANGFAELRWDGYYHDGVPISRRSGDYPRLPVSGLEGRPVEMLLKASRGDLAASADSAFDTYAAQVNYRPCWLLGQ